MFGAHIFGELEYGGILEVYAVFSDDLAGVGSQGMNDMNGAGDQSMKNVDGDSGSFDVKGQK